MCKWTNTSWHVHCRHTWLWYTAFLLLSIEKQPPMADKKEINIVKINTTLSISPFCLRKAVQGTTCTASQQVLAIYKMSNLPLGRLLCVSRAAAPGLKYDAWAAQSRVRGEGLGKGLGIVSGQHCSATLWQLDILTKGDIVFAPGVT